MPAHYDRFGVSFAYPENWIIEDSEDDGTPFPCVTVSSPHTAFWTLSLHAKETNMQSLIEVAVEAIQEEYGNLDIQEIRDDFAGHSVQGCEVNFCYLDLYNTAQIRVFRRNDRICLLLWQAEDTEFELTRKVFDAITTSLLRY